MALLFIIEQIFFFSDSLAIGFCTRRAMEKSKYKFLSKKAETIRSETIRAKHHGARIYFNLGLILELRPTGMDSDILFMF